MEKPSTPKPTGSTKPVMPLWLAMFLFIAVGLMLGQQVTSASFWDDLADKLEQR